MSTLTRFLENMGQRVFPREFRIAPPGDLPDLSALLRVVRDVPPPPPSLPPDQPPPVDTGALDRMLADITTGLWRLQQKLIDPKTKEPLEESRKAYRHFESVWDALTKTGIEVWDHTNSVFDPGMSLNVLAFQPTEGLSRDMIIETIRPTIYLKGRPIQIGQVIVGTPPEQAG